MKIPKHQVLEFVRGSFETLTRADEELPDHVDPDRDSELLAKYGIEPVELLGQLNGHVTRG